jgi:opacity protein-like surface antigen
MNRNKSILALGAVALMSSVSFVGSAVAADMAMRGPQTYYAPPPPPVEEFGGWYLRGDIGFSNQKVKEIRSTNEALYAPVTSLNQTSGVDTGGIYQVGVGYQFNSWLRGDVTGQYRGNANIHGQDLFRANAVGTNVYNYAGVDVYNASKSEWVVMANAYVDLGTWWCVTPFIGAGVGAARVTISNFTDAGQIALSQNQFGAYGPGSQASVATAESGSKWNLAWALHTGLAYKVSPNMTMELGYSYMNLGSGTTGNAARFDSVTAGNKFVFKDITSHDLKLGVRWNLDSPAVYAPPPPPLIRKG